MAKQTGKVKLQGRIGDIVYYKMGGKFYARKASSLTGKRVKRDPKFRRTMEFARIFGVASRLAAAVHRSLPVQKQHYKQYRKMMGKANQWLKEGKTMAEVELDLKLLFLPAAKQSTRPAVDFKGYTGARSGFQVLAVPDSNTIASVQPKSAKARELVAWKNTATCARWKERVLMKRGRKRLRISVARKAA